jgi:hypothetical protein
MRGESDFERGEHARSEVAGRLRHEGNAVVAGAEAEEGVVAVWGSMKLDAEKSCGARGLERSLGEPGVQSSRAFRAQ